MRLLQRLQSLLLFQRQRIPAFCALTRDVNLPHDVVQVCSYYVQLVYAVCLSRQTLLHLKGSALHRLKRRILRRYLRSQHLQL